MLIRYSQVPVQKSLMNVRDEHLCLFNHLKIATLEQRYPTSTYSGPSNTGRLFRWRAKRHPGQSSAFLTSSCSDLCTLSPLQCAVHILALLCTTLAVLGQSFSNAFRPFSTILTAIPTTQTNSSNAKAGPYSLVALLSSKLPQ
jgi:hypothetical protein